MTEPPRYAFEFNEYERANLIRALRTTKIKARKLLARLEEARPINLEPGTAIAGLTGTAGRSRDPLPCDEGPPGSEVISDGKD